MGVLIIAMVLLGIGYAVAWFGAGPQLRKDLGTGAVIGIGLATIAAFLSPIVPLYFAILFVAPLIMVKSRIEAVCRYVLFVALTPSVAWAFGAGGHQLVRLDGIDILTMSTLLSAKLHEDKVARIKGLTAEDGVVAALFLIFWIGVERLASPTIALRDLIQQGLTLPACYYVFRANVRSEREVRRVLACLVAAGVILTVMAVYEAHRGWALYDAANVRQATARFAASSMSRGGGLRASATTGTPLLLAFLLTIVFFAALAVPKELRSNRIMWLWLPLIFLGVYFTKSRSSLAFLVLGVTVFAWARGRKMLAAALLGLGGTGAAALLARGGAAGGSGDITDDYRSLLLRRGLQEGLKHPWGGASLDNVMNRLQDITQGQQIIDFVNTYLEIFLIAGVIGLAPLLALYLSVLRRMLFGFKKIVDQDFLRTRAFFVTAIFLVVIDISVMSFISVIPFCMMMILAGTRLISLTRNQASATPRLQVVRADAPAPPPEPRAEPARPRRPFARRPLGAPFEA